MYPAKRHACPGGDSAVDRGASTAGDTGQVTIVVTQVI